MRFTLYYSIPSGPCLLVQLVAAELGIEFELKFLDLFQRQHFEPGFLKINPHHCVPTLVDNENGLVLWESRAISTYLVDTICPNGHPIYPKDLKLRAKINQWLDHDSGSFGPPMTPMMTDVLFYYRPFDPEKIPAAKSPMPLVDSVLEGNEFVVGDHYTIADMAFINPVAVCRMFKRLGFDMSEFRNIDRWFDRMTNNHLTYYKDVSRVFKESFEMWISDPQKLEKLVRKEWRW